jgi:dihydroorotate dehydrogenase (NAD+) catalytic subunit
MGGIATGRDAADFIAAGAACVAVGTESFRDPAAGRRVAAELDAISPRERGFLPGADHERAAL